MDSNTNNIRDDLSATTTEEAHMMSANKLFLETGGLFKKTKVSTYANNLRKLTN
jgi:Tfp pilus assembly protein PilZ